MSLCIPLLTASTANAVSLWIVQTLKWYMDSEDMHIALSIKLSGHILLATVLYNARFPRKRVWPAKSLYNDLITRTFLLFKIIMLIVKPKFTHNVLLKLLKMYCVIYSWTLIVDLGQLFVCKIIRTILL